MAKAPNRPEEDPAEGSREVIDRELARQDNKDQSGQAEKKDGGGQKQPPEHS